MNKKHFEAIAHTLNANRADLSLVLDMADTLEEFNPLFDRARFVKASTIKVLDETAYTLRMIEQASRA